MKSCREVELRASSASYCLLSPRRTACFSLVPSAATSEREGQRSLHHHRQCTQPTAVVKQPEMCFRKLRSL